MENKLTAVEFLAGNLHYLHSTKWDEILIKAKEMEKEQIIKACIETTQDCWKSLSKHIDITLNFTEMDLDIQKKEAEQYYNETFNK